MNFVGRSVTRLEDRPLVTGQRPVRGRRGLSAHGAYAGGALGPRPWPHRVDRHERGAGAAGRGRGLDVGRRGGHSADRLPPDPHRRPGALPPADPGPAARALCRRTGGGGVRDRSLSGGGRSRSRCRRGRRIAGRARCRRGARGIRRRPLDRAGRDRGKVLRRRRRRVSRRRMPWSSSISRSGAIPACRSKPAVRSRATTPPTTCWNFTAPPRCRTGIATASPACWAAIPPPCICSRAMSAAASASAASFIPRTCWSASPRCGSAGR